MDKFRLPEITLIMNKIFTLLIAFLSYYSYGQVGINTTTPEVSAALDITSTSSGLLIPKMTQAQKNAITSPATGLLIYQTNATAGFYYYDGSAWVTFGSGSGWVLTGDTGTTVGTEMIGTLDAQDLVLVANNSEAMRIDATGLVGIGTSLPTKSLHIVGTAPVLRLEDGNEGVNKVLTSDASGNVSWGSSSVLTSGDADWVFVSGSALTDQVYHNGPVVIGRTGTTTHEVDIDNGATTGTTFGVGDVEVITDGNNETQFSHRIVPDDDGFTDLGSSIYRWKDVWAVNTTIQTSDAREKGNIQPLDYGLKNVMKLRPVTYKWKQEKVGSIVLPENEKREIIGLIAQEVQQVIPEVVYGETWRPKSEQEHDIYVKQISERIGMNYDELLPVLVKAKQEQHQKLMELQAKNKDLLDRVIALNAKKK